MSGLGKTEVYYYKFICSNIIIIINYFVKIIRKVTLIL